MNTAENPAGTTAGLVLKRLRAHKGEPVSGQQIAAELNVSRNAVWKAVVALRESGCVIDAEPRTGYRLVSVPEPLDERTIMAGLSGGLYRGITYVAATDSTNDLAKQHAKAGAPEGAVFITDKQLRGRGRRGRAWETPAGRSLLFSIVLRPNIPPRKVPLLVFLAASAVRAAVAPFGDVFIKWPNDIVAGDGRKLCGILVELDAEHDHVRHCVVGIGVNVNERRQDFPEERRDQATAVSIIRGARVNRVELLQSILNEFSARYEAALTHGFGPVLGEARRHSATLGRAVRVHEPNGDQWLGMAVDLHSDGALLVRPATGGDTVTVYAADVSIRMEETGVES